MKVGSVAPVCSNGVPDKAAVAHAADFVRFEVAVDHAADAAAELVADGLVNAAQVVAGAKEAFEDTAQYLRDRGWKRSVARHTTALVSKGGASTGIYTAGAAWAVLNLINECMNSPWCGGAGADDYRFDMMSGTSTGALVNTVVDLFNSQKDHSDRGNELSALANWFTCSGMNDLYCVRSEPILDLVRSTGGSDSLLEFQGLTKKLRGAVNCGMYKNGSELILNTTDFRSGRLLDLSDGERFSLRTSEDLVQGALASAALPFIVRPAYTLPANYDASVPSFYLDGGIRSEIPIMPVVRRGAERVLVIGSDAPVGSESPKISNALGMATRYIDVTLSGVIETELAQSQSYAEARRLEEIDACHDALAPADGSVESGPVAGACSSEACRDALCEGRWDDLCNGGTRPATSFVAAKSADVRAAPRRQRVTEERSVQLEPLWKMVTLFRDETHIEALHGYTFDPVEQRRLFLAGADAVRVSCARIARLLDMRDPTSAAQSQELASWCAPSLDPGICGNVTHVGKPEACPGPTPPPPASFLAQCR